MRNELNDHKWAVIKPMLPNKPHGVPRANDWCVFYGIFWVLRSSVPWRELPVSYGPPTTCQNALSAVDEQAFGTRSWKPWQPPTIRLRG